MKRFVCVGVGIAAATFAAAAAADLFAQEIIAWIWYERKWENIFVYLFVSQCVCVSVATANSEIYIV